MQVRSSVRSLAQMLRAQVVRRRGRIQVVNRTSPRFRARQGRPGVSRGAVPRR